MARRWGTSDWKVVAWKLTSLNAATETIMSAAISRVAVYWWLRTHAGSWTAWGTNVTRLSSFTGNDILAFVKLLSEHALLISHWLKLRNSISNLPRRLLLRWFFLNRVLKRAVNWSESAARMYLFEWWTIKLTTDAQCDDVAYRSDGSICLLNLPIYRPTTSLQLLLSKCMALKIARMNVERRQADLR